MTNEIDNISISSGSYGTNNIGVHKIAKLVKFRKPIAYLKQYYNGYFMLKRTKEWRAEDRFGNYVTSARTKKQCEMECRRLGYVPKSD